MRENENYWQRLRHRPVTRRGFLIGSGVAAAGSAAVLAGCGDDDDGGDGADPTATSAPGETPDPTATSAPGETPNPTATSAPDPTATTPTGAMDGGQYSAVGSVRGDTLDMHRALHESVGQPFSLALNNLITWQSIEATTIRGDIATGVPEQPDNLTYAFTIRDDVTWHNKAPANGRSLTMDDIQWNIERQQSRLLADGTESDDFYRWAAIYQHIDRVDYIDETHFTITLKAPSTIWLTEMCDIFNVIQYREVSEELEGDVALSDATRVVGTGPYIVVDLDESGARLERNPDYFLRKAGEDVAFFDELVYTAFQDAQAGRLAFEQHQIDILSDRSNDVIAAVASAQPDAIDFTVGNPNRNFSLVYPYAHSPAWSIQNIRQAAGVAVDRVLAGQIQFEGLARPQPPVPWPYVDWALTQEELATTPGYRTDKDEDIKDARALWEAGGGEDLDADHFRMTITESSDQAIKEWFPAMMNENLGTDKFSIEAVPGGTLLQHLLNQEPGGFLGGWTQWRSPDPRQRWRTQWGADGAINFYDYADPVMEDFIAEMFAEFDTVKAKEILREAQRYSLTDGGAGMITISCGITSYVRWPYLENAEPPFIPFERNLLNASFDQSHPLYSSKSRV